ncbi:MAG: M13 family metallopeptidase [Bacteroidales bacterium]|nr:M13 family metallopeptidase [Bacteroidales bacterium]
MSKKIVSIAVLSAAMFAAIFTGCSKKTTEENQLTSGINLENLDTTVSPRVDFYQYACGGWMKNHPLSGEYSRYGSFDELAENNQEQLKTLITEIAAQEQEQGTVAQKIGTLYNLGMDTAKIEEQGATPIQKDLETINNMKSLNDLTAVLVEFAKSGNMPFFGLFGEADPENSDNCIAWVWQTGLGIGAEDYYLEEGMKDKRDAYVVLTSKMLAMSGYSAMAGFEGKEDAMAQKVLDLEMKLAKAFMKKEDARDPFKTTNKVTVDEWQKMLPVIDVKAYIEGLGLAERVETVNMGMPAYMAALNGILKGTDINVIKAYLAGDVVRSAAPYLSSNFVDANFDFYGRVLSGKTEQKPRWKRVVSTVDGCLGEAVGQMYVEKYFPQEAKDKMKTLIANEQEAFRQIISESTWMTDETKAKAIDKLNSFTVKVGFPDKWRDYSALNIDNDSYYANIERASRFEMDYQLSKIGKPVDKTEWGMTPQTVNAYYNPSTNEICFPAGILQPPFFQQDADAAANYGAIGVVIAHEMTHGFDDQGHNYDKNGNLNPWWTEEESASFVERAQVLVDWFNKVEVIEGLYANGAYTLGENIADNGGNNISFRAMNIALEKGEVNKEEMDGFTPAQRFFLAYANVWAANITDAEKVNRTKTDVHSLGRWRVNATLPHINGFADAFGIVEGDNMWLAPEKRAEIWSRNK